MILDLSPIANIDGKKLDIDVEIDFDNNDMGICFLKPVRVLGRMVNMGGSLELSASASTALRYTCDRCLECFEREFECSFDEVLKKEDTRLEDENPDAIYFQGNSLDIDDIVLNNIIVSLPLKSLCSEECKGLCPKCGQNLNLEQCKCDTRVSDPRFDVLDKFFE
ncbi:MAG: DUF177 domain-containing protein [Clostridia bacterium]|nr:DUF177 domain-containing protein [Clostridia bacterium]